MNILITTRRDNTLIKELRTAWELLGDAIDASHSISFTGNFADRSGVTNANYQFGNCVEAFTSPSPPTLWIIDGVMRTDPGRKPVIRQISTVVQKISPDIHEARNAVPRTIICDIPPWVVVKRWEDGYKTEREVELAQAAITLVSADCIQGDVFQTVFSEIGIGQALIDVTKGRVSGPFWPGNKRR